jgi:hypothetical protein
LTFEPAVSPATEDALSAGVPGLAQLSIPNINAATGLSTDYLNHFAEAVMVLEMIVTIPECLDDLMAWQPKSYREHFAGSHFTERAKVIAAYEAADPTVRDALDQASETLNSVLIATRQVVAQHLNTPDADLLAQRAVAWLKPLIARTAAVINGTATGTATDSHSAQAEIDALFNR